MEHRYSSLKRSTLKDLLESRGHRASNKSKATLIAELMEGDRISDQAGELATGGDEMAELQRAIQWRLSLYATPPPQEVITQIIADTTKIWTLKLEKGNKDPAAADQGGHKKLPYAAFQAFQDGEDEIDRYLDVFETQCDLLGIDKAHWITILISKLSGRAKDAFQAIPAEDNKDYDRVKERLLARYAITAEAHRIKFRSLRRREGQPYTEWAHQMAHSVDAWFARCQATTLADAAQLILLEQLYEHSPIDVREWVHDRKPLTMDAAAELADQFLDARRTSGTEIRTVPHPPPAAIPQTPDLTRPSVAPSSTPRTTSGIPTRRTGPRCYACNQVGHMQTNCPRRATRNTWNRPAIGSARAAAHYVESEIGPPFVNWGAEECGILFEANPIQAAANNRQHHRQAVWINGRPAQGLRDSGATITLTQPRMSPQLKEQDAQGLYGWLGAKCCGSLLPMYTWIGAQDPVMWMWVC